MNKSAYVLIAIIAALVSVIAPFFLGATVVMNNILTGMFFLMLLFLMVMVMVLAVGILMSLMNELRK